MIRSELLNLHVPGGITANTQKGHIARATMEAACFQTKAILDAMQMDSGKSLTKLAVDGGMSNSNICMQVGILPLINILATILTFVAC